MDNKKTNDKHSFLQSVKNKLGLSKNHQNHNADDWDDSSHAYSNSDAHTHNSRVFYDKDNPPPKKPNFFFIIIFIIVIALVMVIVSLSLQSKSPRPLDNTIAPSETILKKGEAKLDTPILGTKEELMPSTTLNKDDELAHIDFDFSPIIRTNIARMPMLPDKIKTQKIN